MPLESRARLGPVTVTLSCALALEAQRTEATPAAATKAMCFFIEKLPVELEVDAPHSLQQSRYQRRCSACAQPAARPGAKWRGAPLARPVFPTRMGRRGWGPVPDLLRRGGGGAPITR